MGSFHIVARIVPDGHCGDDIPIHAGPTSRCSARQGATAHRVGPRVKALAHILHYVHGVPVRKTAEIVEQMTGVRLTQSAISQDAAKQTEGPVGERYGELREAV